MLLAQIKNSKEEKCGFSFTSFLKNIYILDFYLYRQVSFKTLKEMDTFSAGTQHEIPSLQSCH